MKRSSSKLAVTTALIVLLVACGKPPSAGGNSPNPANSPGATASAARTPTATPLPPTTASPAPAGLVKCETFPNQTYVNTEYGFSLSCPSGFWWETFGNLPSGWLWSGRTVEDKYKNGYPAGQIEFVAKPLDADTLRHWIDSHTGDPMATPDHDFWNSVSNVRDMTVGGSPAIGFDYVMKGPESPENFHAVALILKSKYVFVMDWWAYASSGYASAIDKVANSVVSSITVS